MSPLVLKSNDSKCGSTTEVVGVGCCKTTSIVTWQWTSCGDWSKRSRQASTEILHPKKMSVNCDHGIEGRPGCILIQLTSCSRGEDSIIRDNGSLSVSIQNDLCRYIDSKRGAGESGRWDKPELVRQSMHSRRTFCQRWKYGMNM